MYEIYDWEKPKEQKEPFWELTQLELEEFAVTLMRHKTFSRCFNPRYNLTNAFWRYIDAKTNYQDHVIITITGRTGSGKSRLAQIIGKRINPRIELKDITFTSEEMLTRCENAPRDIVIIKDEHIETKGLGSEREKAEIQNIEMVMRKYGLSLIFCSPIDFPHDTAHIRMEVLCKNKKRRLTKAALRDKNGVYLGYVILHVPEDKSDHLWMAYDKANKGKKDKFISDLKTRSIKRIDYKAMAKKIENHELWKKYKGRVGDQTMLFIIRDMFPQLADKEHYMIFTARCNFYRKPVSKELSMKEIRKTCRHGDLRFSKRDNKVYCRRCGTVVSQDNVNN